MYFLLYLRNRWDILVFNECLCGFVLKKEIIKIWFVYMLFLFFGIFWFVCFKIFGSVWKINV